MNKLVVFNEQIKIPQNADNNILIKKNISWEASIDIIINIKSPINYLNLILILLCYIWQEHFIIYNVLTCAISTKNNKNIKIFSNENIKWIKTARNDELLDWIKFRINKDSLYIEESDFYSFKLIFEKNQTLNRTKEFLLMMPDYPWNKFIIEKWGTSINSNVMLDTIKKLKEKVTELEKELRQIKK